MAQIDWNEVAAQAAGPRTASRKRRYDGASLRFYFERKINQKKSDTEKRPIYDEIEMLEVWPPGGDRTPVMIDDQVKMEYAPEYAIWKERNEQPKDGTPLAEWSMVPRTLVEELTFFGIKTVEQLANANDEVKRKLGPLNTWCKKAKNWIDGAKCDQNELVILKEQLEREQKRTSKMEEQIELLLRRIESNEGTSMRSVRNIDIT